MGWFTPALQSRFICPDNVSISVNLHVPTQDKDWYEMLSTVGWIGALVAVVLNAMRHHHCAA
eukprot:4345213-Amphidinium_carterae.1